MNWLQKMSAKRQKLYNGAKIIHPTKGLLTIRVTDRGDRYLNPVIWEAIGQDGKPAAPMAFSERELHFMLKWWAKYHFPRKITHVAVREANGRIWSLPKPNRHGDVIKLMQQQNVPTDNSVCGFLDEKGTWFTRKDAWFEAYGSDQILPPYNPTDPSQRTWELKPNNVPSELFSEDIW